MPTTLEHLNAPEIFLLRQGPEHFVHGDPYRLTGVVEVFGSYAVLKGFSGLLEVPGFRAELRKIGVRSVTWVRSKNGVFIPHSLEVG